MSNPIRKMHVGWEQSWSGYGVTRQAPKPVRQWAAICPKCKVMVRAKSSYYYGNTAKNSRKVAKDALYHHMLVNH